MTGQFDDTPWGMAGNANRRLQIATHETDGLPGITMWDIARSLGRLENHSEQADAGMDRQDARMDRMEARLDRMEARLDHLFLALFGFGTALVGGMIIVMAKLFAG